MTEQEFLEELKEVHKFANEIRDYTHKSWAILAHRKRVFAVNHECIYIDQQERERATVSGRMWLWVDDSTEEIFAGFSVESFSDYVKCYGYSYSTRQYLHFTDHSCLRASVALCRQLGYCGFSMEQTFCRMFQDDFTQGILCLKQGLVRLFAYVQEECAHCAREFASDETVRLWREYDKGFIERMNNKYIMEQLVKTVRQVEDASGQLRLKSGYSTLGAYISASHTLQQVEHPLEAVLKLTERVNQATEERKLFI